MDCAHRAAHTREAKRSTTRQRPFNKAKRPYSTQQQTRRYQPTSMPHPINRPHQDHAAAAQTAAHIVTKRRRAPNPNRKLRPPKSRRSAQWPTSKPSGSADNTPTKKQMGSLLTSSPHPHRETLKSTSRHRDLIGARGAAVHDQTAAHIQTKNAMAPTKTVVHMHSKWNPKFHTSSGPPSKRSGPFPDSRRHTKAGSAAIHIQTAAHIQANMRSGPERATPRPRSATPNIQTKERSGQHPNLYSNQNAQRTIPRPRG